MAAEAARAYSPSWRDRFYTIEGQRLPSVTTVLDIIAKPALGPWYAKDTLLVLDEEVGEGSTGIDGESHRHELGSLCPRCPRAHEIGRPPDTTARPRTIQGTRRALTPDGVSVYSADARPRSRSRGALNEAPLRYTRRDP